MAKSILYRILGLGRIPKDYKAALASEGLVLTEEGVRGSVSFRKFKAPGRRYSKRKSWFSGSVAITQKRVIAFAFSKRVINVPFDDPRLRKLNCSAEDDACLCFSFEAADFNPEMSGSVEVRFATPQAQLFAEKVRSAALSAH